MLILSLILYILSCAVNLKKDLSILYSRVLFFIFLSSGLLSYNVFFFNFLNKGLSIFGGLFSITSLNSSFNIFVLFIGIIIILLNTHYPRLNSNFVSKEFRSKNISESYYNKSGIHNSMNEQYINIEYALIILFVIIGGIFLMASNDVISMFLSIELQSYGLYIVCASYRNSESSTSAGLTYFLLGALASSFILLSTSLIYANSGSSCLENFYIISNIAENINNTNIINKLEYDNYYLYISLVILSIGFLIKISASPFHFWSPDVYDAVPTIVTTFISILPKITILIFILDIVTHININIYIYNWTSVFVMSSLLSLIIGTVLGLTQIRIKRLFAYSTISHLGFLLLCLSIETRESIQAFIFYLMQYSISNLNAFFILITIGYSLYMYVYTEKNAKHIEKVNIKEINNSPIQLIEQLKGYFYINPILSLSLAITLFSFAGIPPLVGFFAKLMVLSASIDSGYIFMSLVAILTSVIGGVYYLAIIKKMFFDNPCYELNCSVNTYVSSKYIYLSSSLTVIISMLTALILLFIFIPTECLNYTSILSMTLLNY